MAKTNFSNGDASQGIHGTRVTAEFLNAVNSHYHTGLDQDGHGALAYAADTGTANAYVVTLSPALSQYVTGMPIYFKAANANTGASTIDVNGLGQAPVKRFGNDLQAGDIQAGQITSLAYDGTSFQIMSGSPPQIIDVTYAQLSAIVTAGTLVPGQTYRITDFRTKHLILNTSVYNTATTEPLIVEALSENKLSTVARNTTYPDDIIYYELVYSGIYDSAGDSYDRGHILRRVDTRLDNDIAEDFRAIVNRRWNTQADGLGTYTVLTDNGNPHQDFTMFDPNYYGAGWDNRDNYIKGILVDFDLQLIGRPVNIIFKGNYNFNNHFGSECRDITFNTDQNYNNIFGGQCHALTFLGDCYANTLGERVHTSTINNNFAKNQIGSHCSNNIFTDIFMNNTIGCNCSGNTFSSTFQCHVRPTTANKSFVASISKTLDNDSSFEVTVAITGPTNLDVSSSSHNYAGKVNVTSANAAESLNRVTANSDVNFEVAPEDGLSLEIQGTPFSSIIDNYRIILGASTRILDGSKKDFIVLRKVTITNGNGTFDVMREVSVSIGV